MSHYGYLQIFLFQLLLMMYVPLTVGLINYLICVNFVFKKVEKKYIFATLILFYAEFTNHFLYTSSRTSSWLVYFIIYL